MTMARFGIMSKQPFRLDVYDVFAGSVLIGTLTAEEYHAIKSRPMSVKIEQGAWFIITGLRVAAAAVSRWVYYTIFLPVAFVIGIAVFAPAHLHEAVVPATWADASLAIRTILFFSAAGALCSLLFAPPAFLSEPSPFRRSEEVALRIRCNVPDTSRITAYGRAKRNENECIDSVAGD